MVPVLMGWYLYENTGSAFALGMLGLSEVIPAILLALPAGVRADTGLKRLLIIQSLAGYILLLCGLIFVTSFVFDGGWMKWLIYLIIGGTGIVRAYLSPSFSALLSQVVRPEKLVEAASVNSMIWLAAAVVGPLIAGISIGWVGVFFSLILALVFVLVALACIYQVKETPPSRLVSVRTWESVKEGLVFLQEQKSLMGTMGLDMLAVLFGGAVAILPVFAKDILFVGPTEFGLLQSATYAGNFLSILYLTKFPLRKNQGMILYRAVFGFGLCILLFGLSPWFWLSFVALFASGLFDGVSVIIRGTIFQVLVPETMRGRVSSVNSIFINSSNELGQFESGMAASLMGPVPSVIFGGIMTLVVTVLFYFRIPSLKKLQY